MASWLQRLFKSSTESDVLDKELATQTVNFDQTVGQKSGLDFNAAVNAHLAWKKRLNDLLLSKDGRDALDPLHVCRDDQCDLGKWIHGDAARIYSVNESFSRLRKVHADFHQAAAKIISLAQAGKDEEAQEALHTGDFARCSNRVKTELSRMYLDLGGS